MSSRVCKIPASVYDPPTQQTVNHTNSASRKCWPDQKYVVKLPSAEEMEALRRRRAAAGIKIGSLPDVPSPSMDPATAPQISAKDQASLKQSSEVKKEGTVVKVPTAEAIAALQRRRAAAKADASKSPALVAADGSKPVDYCAIAREATARSKAAAHINAPSPIKHGQKGSNESVYSSFLRNKPSADPAAVARKQAEAEAKAKEAEALRERRAAAAKASQTEGKTVRLPTPEELEALKKRRDAHANQTGQAPKVVLSQEQRQLMERRAQAARESAGSGLSVKVPDVAEIEALRQRRAAAQKPAAVTVPVRSKPAQKGMSVYEKLQAQQSAPKTQKALTTASKRQAEALEGDLRSILSKKSRSS